MRITTESQGDQGPVTALIGVLESLYEAHLTLLSVERLKD